MRRKKRKKKRSGWIWFAALTGILCGAVAGSFVALTKDLPQIVALENYKPSAITRVYSSDNVLLAELFSEKRDPVPLSRMPAALKTALITTEDRRFYDHRGVAFKGILRAIIQNLRKRRFAQGASTLTQQLAKTLFLTPRKTLLRKMREAILALQLERRYTKDELLALYLNQIYFGSGTYGVASAARVYFNKELNDLTLAQCALIAGLPKAPSTYSPLANPHLAVKRRNIILKQMLITGAVSEGEYEAAVEEPLVTPKQPPNRKKTPHFINHIRKQLEDTVGADQLYKGGLTVYTTLSHRIQSDAETGFNTQMAALEARRQTHNLTGTRTPQAALVAIDIKTGGLIAMIGGYGEQKGSFNRATMAKRQPGSSFKPIIYALAAERGYSQHQTLLDAPVVFQSSLSSNSREWAPENFSNRYDGEITMRWALAKSKNIPVVRLIEQLGPSSVVQFGRALGIQSKLAPNLSLALGTSEVSLLELTAAYATFANQGKYTEPYGVTRVVDDTGKTIWSAKPKQRMAMSRSGAAIITNMLESVVKSGTGRRARALPGPVAGKTGTTNDYKDALFIGFSPCTAVGVWVGNDDASTLGPRETGAKSALPIWIDTLGSALEGRPQEYFDIPDDVRQIYIHPKTGESLKAGQKGAVAVIIRRKPSR